MKPGSELLSTLMSGLTLLLIFGLLAWNHQHTRRTHRNTMQAIARRFKGTVHGGTFLIQPWMDFEVRGVKACLTYQPAGKHTPPILRVAFDWPMRGRLRVAHEGLLAGVRKVFGAQDIQIDDDELDDRFMIQGTPAGWARGLFSLRVKHRIRRLLQLCSGSRPEHHFTIEGGPNGLVVHLPARVLKDAGRLQNLLGETARLFNLLREQDSSMHGTPAPESEPPVGSPRDPEAAAPPDDENDAWIDEVTGGDFPVERARPDGLTILSVSQQSGEEASCPICGERLGEAVRRCDRCDTMHHEDCWTYFGGCAVFACHPGRGKRQRRSHRAR